MGADPQRAPCCSALSLNVTDVSVRVVIKIGALGQSREGSGPAFALVLARPVAGHEYHGLRCTSPVASEFSWSESRADH
jgi:hypothetical protein